MKTRQVLDIQDKGYHFSVIYFEGQTNPYRIYRRWYNQGEHKKLCMKYADLNSCLWWFLQANIF